MSASHRIDVVATLAAALCLSLSPVGAISSAPPAQPAAAQGASAPSGDAAAKHAKRTACLKEAKAKKLVGAEKTAFLKTCIDAP
jgi:hypothetical protein